MSEPSAPRPRPKKSDKHDIVAEDIVSAICHGESAVVGMEDGGTCNLDSVRLKTRKSAALERACAARGLHLDHCRYSGEYNVVGGSRAGQGQRATAFCRAVANYLKERGHNARVFYFTD